MELNEVTTCSDDYEKETKEEKAKSLGLVVRKPKPNELFVDLDSEQEFETFAMLLRMMAKHAPDVFPSTSGATIDVGNLPPWVAVTPSKGGLPRRHVVVTLAHECQNEFERIALQAMLGSDRKREVMSYCEWKTGSDKDPVVFFEKDPALRELGEAALGAMSKMKAAGYPSGY